MLLYRPWTSRELLSSNPLERPLEIYPAYRCCRSLAFAWVCLSSNMVFAPYSGSSSLAKV